MGLMCCLPNLAELDISRVDIGTYDLCQIIQGLGPSLKRLAVDGLTLCRGFLAVVLDFSNLEYLSLSMCDISKDVLRWFMSGTPEDPKCEHEGWERRCLASARMFKARAGTVMSSLKELDLTYQAAVDAAMLHAFHIVRLNRLPAAIAHQSLDPTRMRPRPIHIDLRGCSELDHKSLSDIQLDFPGTRVTPRVSPFRWTCVLG